MVTRLYNEVIFMGRVVVVSVLAFYSDNRSLNPTEVYNFSLKLLLERTKINKKEPEIGPFKKEVIFLL